MEKQILENQNGNVPERTQVTKEYLESIVLGKAFFHTEKTTVCILTLQNGFEVVGMSGVVDKSKFDRQTGEGFAYEDAFNQLWKLEGYVLQYELNKYTKQMLGIGTKKSPE